MGIIVNVMEVPDVGGLLGSTVLSYIFLIALRLLSWKAS